MGSPVCAQDIVVRTGDHPRFTRIVFAIPPDTPWTIGRTEDGYGIRFDTDEAIDPRQFFERIQRDRVTDFRLIEGGSTMNMILGCDCFAEAYLWRNDHVVVDIKDPGQPQTEGYAVANAAPLFPIKPVEREPLNPHPPIVEQSTAETPDVAATQTPVSPLKLGLTERRPINLDPLLPDPLARLAEQQARVSALETAMADGLGRALSQGLLDASESRPLPETVITTPTLDEQGDLESLLADINAVLSPGLTARTSVDNAANGVVSTAELSSNGVECLPDDFTAVASWASDLPFHLQIGERRNAVTAEFDRTDPDAIEALAKTYLYFGFGREAINALSIDGGTTRERQVLIAIGRIIDNDPVQFDQLRQQLGCDGPTALWGFLAHEDEPYFAEIDVENILYSLKLLPPHLRAHLAPRVAEKLTEVGFSGEAESALSIALDDPNVEAAIKVTESNIALAQGKSEDAERLLEDLADDNPRMTPEALLSLIALKIENGSEIHDSELELVRAMQFESQDDGQLDLLYHAEIDTLLHMQKFDETLRVLAQNAEHFDLAEIFNYQDTVLQHVVRSETDEAFLTHAFQADVQPTSQELQNAFAQRLILLGFPEKASEIVSGPAIGADMTERRYLRAEIAVALNDKERAKAHLSGVESPRATRILAQAGVIVPDAELAETSQDVRQEIDWRTGQWDRLGESEDPLLEAVAARVEDAATFSDQTASPLADSRDLITSSEELRSNMHDLLERFAIASE